MNTMNVVLVTGSWGKGLPREAGTGGFMGMERRELWKQGSARRMLQGTGRTAWPGLGECS